MLRDIPGISWVVNCCKLCRQGEATLAWSKALDIIEAMLDEDTTKGIKEGPGEEGRALCAGPELRGVQDCGGTQDCERTDAKFVAKLWAGTSF